MWSRAFNLSVVSFLVGILVGRFIFPAEAQFAERRARRPDSGESRVMEQASQRPEYAQPRDAASELRPEGHQQSLERDRAGMGGDTELVEEPVAPLGLHVSEATQKAPTTAELRAAKMIDMLVDARLRAPGSYTATLLSTIDGERNNVRGQLESARLRLTCELDKVESAYDDRDSMRRELSLSRIRDDVVRILQGCGASEDVIDRALAVSPSLGR